MRSLLASIVASLAATTLLAQVNYEQGDTLRFTAAFVDSAATATLPDSARLYVLLRGAIIDSSVTYPSGGISRVGGTKQMAGTYVVPDVGSLPALLNLVLRCDGDGFTNDLGLIAPRYINVNAEIGTVKNLWGDIATGEWAVVDSSSCTPCGVYRNSLVSDGEVYITRGATLSSVSTVESHAIAALGEWEAALRVSPTSADTFYVWRRASASSFEDGVMLVVP